MATNVIATQSVSKERESIQNSKMGLRNVGQVNEIICFGKRSWVNTLVRFGSKRAVPNHIVSQTVHEIGHLSKNKLENENLVVDQYGNSNSSEQSGHATHCII